MLDRMIVSLEARRLFSLDLPVDLPGGIDPGQFENFNGVLINASKFPSSAVTVQKTSQGPVVALPILRDGVVTGTATGGADNVTIETRTGVDQASALPGIVFFDGVEAGATGVQIFGSVSEAVAGFGSIRGSLQLALTSLQSTRDILASFGASTAALDDQLATLGEQFGAVNSALDKTLTSPFVRVTVAGQYDAYFLADEVKDVRIDTGAGDDVVTSGLRGTTRLVISGGAGNDVLTAAGPSTLMGGAGNDRLVAGQASWMDGGAGNDVLIGSPDSDTMVNSAGKDTLDQSRNRPGVKDRIGNFASSATSVLKQVSSNVLVTNRQLFA